MPTHVFSRAHPSYLGAGGEESCLPPFHFSLAGPSTPVFLGCKWGLLPIQSHDPGSQQMLALFIHLRDYVTGTGPGWGIRQ
jgi:hypothetical protein